MACDAMAWMLLGAQLSSATAYAALAKAKVQRYLTSCLVCVYTGPDQHLASGLVCPSLKSIQWRTIRADGRSSINPYTGMTHTVMAPNTAAGEIALRTAKRFREDFRLLCAMGWLRITRLRRRGGAARGRIRQSLHAGESVRVHAVLSQGRWARGQNSTPACIIKTERNLSYKQIQTDPHKCIVERKIAVCRLRKCLSQLERTDRLDRLSVLH